MKKEKSKILIVDDSMVILERMIPMLEDIDNIQFVIHAGSYKEAMDLLNGMTPDLALLDIHLPDRSGIDLLRAIKEKGGNTKVLMITNSATDHYRNICRQLGAEHFFDKSSDFHLIPDVIVAECALM